MRVALDTNLLVYAVGVRRVAADVVKIARARVVTARLQPDLTVIPVVVLAELFQVMVHRDRQSPVAARAAVLAWRRAGLVQPTTEDVLLDAADLAADHGLTIFDAIILAAAATAGCDWLLSEDLHAGFVHRGVTIANPFAPAPPRALATLLA